VDPRAARGYFKSCRRPGLEALCHVAWTGPQLPVRRALQPADCLWMDSEGNRRFRANHLRCLDEKRRLRGRWQRERKAMLEATRDRLRSLGAAATNALEAVLDAAQTPADKRKAAEMVLHLLGFDDPQKGL
jgi:hypothetical protein